jgi:hypothetical protein
MSDSKPLSKTVVLGREYDRDLRDVVIGVLREQGATSRDSSWGVAGSQELATLEADLDGHTIVVEAETYIGLSITGEADLVDRLAALVRRRSPNAGGAAPRDRGRR